MTRGADTASRIRESLELAQATLAELADRMCADIDVGATAIVRCAAMAVAGMISSDPSTVDVRLPSLVVANAYWALEYLIDVGFDRRVPDDLALRGYDKRVWEAALTSVRQALSDLEGIEHDEQSAQVAGGDA